MLATWPTQRCARQFPDGARSIAVAARQRIPFAACVAAAGYRHRRPNARSFRYAATRTTCSSIRDALASTSVAAPVRWQCWRAVQRDGKRLIRSAPHPVQGRRCSSRNWIACSSPSALGSWDPTRRLACIAHCHDAWRRRRTAIVRGQSSGAGQPLGSCHYERSEAIPIPLRTPMDMPRRYAPRDDIENRCSCLRLTFSDDGRGLALEVARKRDGLRIRLRQSGQIHRTGRSCGDRGLRQLRHAEGDARRADPGDELLCLLVLVGAAAIWFTGFETRGRTIGEIDSTLNAPAAAGSSTKVPAE